MKSFFIPLVIFSAFACSNDGKRDIVRENFNFADRQLSHAITEVEEAYERLGAPGESGKVNPRTIDKNGQLVLVASRDWTSGFFPGELWYMYEYTGDEKWAQSARRFTAPLEREKSNGVTHDMGFKVYCSFGNGYRLTGDPHYREVMLEAARTLITRYNPVAKVLRSWDHNSHKWDFPVIIDNMMNLELLFWASRESGDPVFFNIAVDHARTTMQNHFRADYGSYHVVDYEVSTGEVRKKNTHQGYADESTWARGEAWALYGYTMVYRETRMPEFLEQAKNIAGFIFGNDNLPPDLIPYWDYNAPDIPAEPRDVSAATPVASALYELSTYVPEMSDKYKGWADTIMLNLTEHYRAHEGQDRGFLLLHSTGSKPSDLEVDVPLVYADYYFLEALLRKQRLEAGEQL